jgi:PIN domain nuclease of toxin-antitoxin system
VDEIYLLDTHALIFWFNREHISNAFIDFLDDRKDSGNLAVSSISFWEIALLVKKGRIALDDLAAWRIQVIEYTNITEIIPTAAEMIESVHLPDHHKDPFDRLLVVQANKNNAVLVTKDEHIAKYTVKTFWL